MNIHTASDIKYKKKHTFSMSTVSPKCSQQKDKWKKKDFSFLSRYKSTDVDEEARFKD